MVWLRSRELRTAPSMIVTGALEVDDTDAVTWSSPASTVRWAIPKPMSTAARAKLTIAKTSRIPAPFVLLDQSCGQASSTAGIGLFGWIRRGVTRTGARATATTKNLQSIRRPLCQPSQSPVRTLAMRGRFDLCGGPLTPLRLLNSDGSSIDEGETVAVDDEDFGTELR